MSLCDHGRRTDAYCALCRGCRCLVDVDCEKHGPTEAQKGAISALRNRVTQLEEEGRINPEEEAAVAELLNGLATGDPVQTDTSVLEGLRARLADAAERRRRAAQCGAAVSL